MSLTLAATPSTPSIRLAGRVLTPHGVGTVRNILTLANGQPRYSVTHDDGTDGSYRAPDVAPLPSPRYAAGAA